MVRQTIVAGIAIIAIIFSITSIAQRTTAQQATPRRNREPLPDIDASWRDNADPDFTPRRLMRPLDPITEFKTSSVADANSKKEIRPNELVLAVSVNGKHRAYPINMLTGPRREIINDTVGGRNIAATW